MKNIITLILLCTSIQLSAQIVNIPDANLKAALLSYTPTIDTNSDGEIQVSEAEIPGGLSLLSLNIVDMTGIQSFTNLTFLQCPNNLITTLDLTGLQNLENVSLTGNPLTSLNINNLTNLRYLYLNNCGLTNLDLSTNTSLIELISEGNELTTLDLSACTNLDVLRCASNNITSMNLSQNVNLTILDCEWNSLNTLDVSQNVNLEMLNFGHTNITSLDLTQNVNLITLRCESSLLTSLDVSQCTSLQVFYAQHSMGFTDLDFSQNSNLQSFDCDSCASLENLNIKNGSIENTIVLESTNINYVCADEAQVTSLQATLGGGVVVDSSCSSLQFCILNDDTIESAGINNESIGDVWDSENLLILESCTDTCDGNPPVSVTSDYDFANLVASCGLGGTITVNYTITDACATETNVTAILTLEDTIAPDLTSCNVYDETIECDGFLNQVIADDWNAGNIAELQACADDISVMVTSDFAFTNTVSTCGASGTIEVEYTVTDDCNNSSTIIATLTLEDSTGPDLTNCGVTDESILIECNGVDNETIANAWNQANILALQPCGNDNCDADATYDVTSDFDFSNITSNCVFGSPSLPVTYTVLDDCDNETTITLSITFVPLDPNSNSILGVNRYDFDNNGCDANDTPSRYMRVNIDDGTNTGVAFTNNVGEYSFTNLLAGNFTLTPELENSTFFSATPIDATINFPNVDSSVATQDFCIIANGVHPDVEIVVAPIGTARPGFDAQYLITYKNKGNLTLSGDFSFTYDAAVLDYVSATVTPTTEVTGLITWDYVDLLPFESRSVYVTLNVNSPQETPAINIGDQFDFTVVINPIVGDELPNDNTFNYTQTVTGSYDPNDITCLEGDVTPTSEIGEYLHYIINFENTGNAQAENIAVTTEVDPTQFDINTLRLLSSSHNADVRIDGNVVKIVFNAIYLDSGGHGNILLKVQTLGTLETNDTVTNKANIYFDYNFPVETNDANTTFQLLSVVEHELDNTIHLYPNPVKDVLTISAKNTIKNIFVFDLQGRLLQSKVVESNEIKLDLSSRVNGVYFVKIATDKGVSVEKVIKN